MALWGPKLSHIWPASYTGVTFASKRALQAMTARQTRAIARRPAHLTHITNEQVREILHAEDPFVTLTRQGEKMQRKLEQIAADHPQDIRGIDIAREQLQHVMATFRTEESREATAKSDPAGEEAEYKCQHCDKGF